MIIVTDISKSMQKIRHEVSDQLEAIGYRSSDSCKISAEKINLPCEGVAALQVRAQMIAHIILEAQTGLECSRWTPEEIKKGILALVAENL